VGSTGENLGLLGKIAQKITSTKEKVVVYYTVVIDPFCC